MPEKLKKPLVAEVVCEFTFEPKETSDSSFREKLYSAVKDEYPERTELKIFGMQLQPSGSMVQAPAERLQLKKPDGSAMLQVQPHLLAVNILEPYPGWEVVRTMVWKALRQIHGGHWPFNT